MSADAMLYAQELTAALLIVTLLVASYASYRHRTRWRREERRFRERPLPGDKAGYFVSLTVDGVHTYMVGVVRTAHLNFVGAHPGWWVGMDIEYGTALGLQHVTGAWPIDSLRWFPPDTPLGRYEEPAK